MESTANHPVRTETVMALNTLVHNELSRILSCGTFICIRLPLRTLRVIWRTQLLFMTLPFRCTYSVYHMMKQTVMYFFLRPKKPESKSMLESFIECEINEKESVLKSIQEIRTGSFLAVAKMDILGKELSKYHAQLHGWKSEAEKQTRHMAAIAEEERKLLKLVIGSLKHLRRLKTSREALDSQVKTTVEDLFDLSKLCSRKCSTSVGNALTEEINSVLKAGYNRLHKQTEQMRCIIDKKRNIINSSCINSDVELLSGIEGSSRLNKLSNSIGGETEGNLLTLSMETLETTIGLLNTENLQLKKRLEATSDQLVEVRTTSVTLNKKILHLELQLQQVRQLLFSVESDRDQMRDKLSTLQQMIEEEELYLNVSCLWDDNYNELIAATRKLELDQEFSSLEDNACVPSLESDDESWDKQDLPSVELSLSR